ncbi:MAG: hypothetical protein QUU85_18795, partial [Candidatus Eisenbacteria bacterium]|nr:hypothetical protein [Candidatus Eisenbacteria bacterium]
MRFRATCVSIAPRQAGSSPATRLAVAAIVRPHGIVASAAARPATPAKSTRSTRSTVSYTHLTLPTSSE